MRAEHRTTGSTGGTAPLYNECMRNGTIISIGLILAPLLHACSGDAPTRPADGSVEAWGACVWDDQLVFELCQPDLVCSWHGICSPTCEMAVDCPAFDGFDNYCGAMEDKFICVPRCDAKKECPANEGAPLTCVQGFCEGEL